MFRQFSRSLHENFLLTFRVLLLSHHISAFVARHLAQGFFKAQPSCSCCSSSAHVFRHPLPFTHLLYSVLALHVKFDFCWQLILSLESEVLNRLAPFSVSRYFCLLLRGLSGMVISISPASKRGFKTWCRLSAGFLSYSWRESNEHRTSLLLPNGCDVTVLRTMAYTSSLPVDRWLQCLQLTRDISARIPLLQRFLPLELPLWREDLKCFVISFGKGIGHHAREELS